MRTIKSASFPGPGNVNILFFLLIAFSLICSGSKAQVLPSGFSQSVVGNIYYPTSMAFAADGRIFTTEKAGKVKIVKNGSVLATPFLTVSVDQLNERGLSSVCLDPNFSINHYVYIYYTVPTNTSTGVQVHNRLSRFTANGDLAVAGSEFILLEIEPAANSIHNAGGMAFGPDGKLYIGIGDDGSDSNINYTNPNSQNLNTYKGKLLRLNSDGSAPSGNPFTGSEPAKRVWAYGFRNPWTVDIQPGTGRIFVNDVGQDGYEEINDATSPGLNFGWPFAEGPSTNTAYTNPFYAYPHGVNDAIGCAITGGAFFNPSSTTYPAAYFNKYFYLDYCNMQINYVDLSTRQSSNFGSSLGGANNCLKVGNDGNLYYYSISNNLLYKISYNQNSPPAITRQPTSLTVQAGQTATFSASAIGASPLTWQWRKNGVDITGANQPTYSISNAQQTDAGQYNVKVTNAYGSAVSNSAAMTVTSAPVGTICSATGFIERDYWANIAGTSVSLVPVNSAPTSTSLLNIFEGPMGAGSNYASRIHGYVCPPSTGSYTFWIASDDNSELWLSTNDNPANKVKIAYVPSWTHSREWTKYTSQQSVPIALVAGQKYYIEALHKQGTLGDNIAVGWELPNTTLERPIPGMRLSPWTGTNTSSIPLVSITSPLNNSSFSDNSNISITANASSSGNSISKVEFFENGVKLGEVASSPYAFLWSNVTTGTYTLTAKATDNLNNFSVSSPVIINVSSCSTPTVYASGPTKFCTGSVILNAPLGAGYLYQWKKDGVDIPGATLSTYTASVTGGYQIKLISGSCIAWSAPIYVTVTNTLSARITPDGPTTFCSGQHVILYANACSGFTYQWILNGTPISGATGASYVASNSGTFQLKVTQSGLSVWSSLVPVTVESCTASAIASAKLSLGQDSLNPKHPFQMKIYPNPNSGMFTISMNIANVDNVKAEMKIINILGQTVYSKDFTGQTGLINHIVELESSNPPGLYVMQMTMGDKVETTNVLLAK